MSRTTSTASDTSFADAVAAALDGDSVTVEIASDDEEQNGHGHAQAAPPSVTPDAAAGLPEVAQRLDDGGYFPAAYHQPICDKLMENMALDMPNIGIKERTRILRSYVDMYCKLVETGRHRTERGYVLLLQMQMLVSVCKTMPGATGAIVTPNRSAIALLPGNLPLLLRAINRPAASDAHIISVPILAELPSCRLCEQPANMRCSRCLDVFYCCRECQRDDHFDHQRPCKVAAAEREAAATKKRTPAPGARKTGGAARA